MAGRAVAAVLVLSVFALIVTGVNYVMDYLGKDVLLDFYPLGTVSLDRLLKNAVVFAVTMVGWLITLFALILGIFQLGREESW